MSKEHKRSLRWFMELAYDGTEFSGWQIQPNGITVQEVLEEKLAQIYANQPIRVESSGRTDAGVHALGQTVTFTCPERPVITEWKLLKSLNRMLPESIRIREIKQVYGDFHARYSALGKAYTYIINKGEQSPFLERWSWHLPQWNACRLQQIRKATSCLEGTHDFSSFTVERKNIDNAVRTIYRIDVQEFGQILCITFLGDGFLYKMIRGIMGTLAFVGSGTLKPDDVTDILNSKNRSLAYDTAPSKGLFLVKVFYKDKEWEDFRLKQPPFMSNPDISGYSKRYPMP